MDFFVLTAEAGRDYEAWCLITSCVVLTGCCLVLKEDSSPTLSEALASKTSVKAYQTAWNYVLETANLLYKFTSHSRKMHLYALQLQPVHH